MIEKNSVVACITAQLTCKSIIDAGKNIASKLNCGLTVVTIQGKEQAAERRAKDLKTLNMLSKICDCDINIIYSGTPVVSLASYINKIKPCHILIGNPNKSSSFFNEFMASKFDAPVSVVSKKILYTLPPQEYNILVNSNIK